MLLWYNNKINLNEICFEIDVIEPVNTFEPHVWILQVCNIGTIIFIYYTYYSK